MRTARLLVLIAYLATQSGWVLPLPDGGTLAGACACGATCRCAQEVVKAGKCCCASGTESRNQPVPKTCCATKPRSCCASQDTKKEQDKPLAWRACNCQQESPGGMTIGSDPRLIARLVTLPEGRDSDVVAPGSDPAAPHVCRSPDDPVPRLTV